MKRTNKRKIIDLIKQLQKEICKTCPEIEYYMCKKCKLHILTNKAIEELNGIQGEQ